MAKQVYVERGNQKASYNKIMDDCVASCKKQGGRVKDIQQNLRVYIKAEEGKAYWVLGDLSGAVNIDFE